MNIIKKALKIMESEFKESTEKFSSSALVKDYCRLQQGNEPEEVFSIMFLDTHLRLLSFDKLFRGSVSEATISFRAIARKVFEYNAAKIIICHNHPSGCVTPSDADIAITKKLHDFLIQIDCKVIDHIIVSAVSSISMVEKDLI